MGTNFWLTLPGAEPLHIGKRSSAGNGLCSFGMQGHRDELEVPLWTWRQWRNLIALPGSLVLDEYDRARDPHEFIAMVEQTTPENRRRQWQWMVDHGHPALSPTLTALSLLMGYRGDWLCPDGFSFTWSDFS